MRPRTRPRWQPGALRSHLCSEIVGTTTERMTARSTAEALFGAISKRGGKIPVVRR